MPKVVIKKGTGEIVYIQSPDFEDGKGIENACKLRGFSPDELEEVNLSQEEIDESRKKEKDRKANLRNAIQAIKNAANPTQDEKINMVYDYLKNQIG
jgi:hypothetical protein